MLSEHFVLMLLLFDFCWHLCKLYILKQRCGESEFIQSVVSKVLLI